MAVCRLGLAGIQLLVFVRLWVWPPEKFPKPETEDFDSWGLQIANLQLVVGFDSTLVAL